MTIHILTKKYKFKIRLIKFICVSLTISLSIIFLFITRDHNRNNKLSLKLLDHAENNDDRQNDFHIDKAKFYSTTSENEPFEIHADKILQINPSKFLLTKINMVLSKINEHKITLNSNEAIWSENERLFELKGNIDIDIGNEYVIKSKTINLNFNEKTLISNDTIKIIGHGYELNARGIDYKKDNNKINFLGPVNLKINI